MSDEPALLERFPALARLSRLRRRRVPIILQLTATECGVACLAMTLAYHGRWVRLDVLRDLAGIGRDGASALVLLQVARRYGLTGRGLSLEPHELEFLETGAILHWEFNHFVVFERAHERGVEIVDPALGRRSISHEELRRCFTGVALALESSPELDRASERSRSLLQYLRQALHGVSGVARVLLLSALVQVFALALPLVTSLVVDRVVPLSDRHLFTVLVSGVAGLLLFSFVTSLVRAQLLLELRTRIDLRMTLRFVEHLVSLPWSFFQRRHAGDLLMRLNSHSTIRELLTDDMLSGLLDAAMVTSYLLLIWVIDARAGLAVSLLGLLQACLIAGTRDAQRARLAESLQAQARAEGYQLELVTGIESLKAAGSEARAVDAWTDLFVDTLHAGLRRGRLNAVVDAIASTLRLGSPLVLLALGAWQVLDGSLSLGAMLGLNALALGFLQPLASLLTTASKFQLLASYYERVADVLLAQPEQDLRERRVVEHVSGRIELEQVSFRYSELAPWAVRDVSLRVQPGQFVAIVGPSGSGKSSLASLMLGLHAPSAGRVLIDGADLTALELGSLRRSIGVALQQPQLFSTSLRANIALKDPAIGLDAVVAAAKLAQIHDEICAMPMAYDTPIIAGGSALSGGQRQRVALARALVRRPAILLLDEATSALDGVTERKVQVALASLAATRIVVAHRLSTVLDADVILVMVEGRIVQQGTHRELIARAGPYRDLVSAQLPRAAAG
ncbi:MAG TPA: peptidase domain-containing ABC transporter [Polyangiales bacterium]|nr:peptidase domain-containing ABC transporter [Polyangiales bacterium]